MFKAIVLEAFLMMVFLDEEPKSVDVVDYYETCLFACTDNPCKNLCRRAFDEMVIRIYNEEQL